MHLHGEGQGCGQGLWGPHSPQQQLQKVNHLHLKLNQRSRICRLFWTREIDIRENKAEKGESGCLWKTGLRKEAWFSVMF